MVFQAMVVDIAIELLAHSGAAAVEAGLDHIYRQVKHLCRFLGAEFLQIAKQDYGAVEGRQFVVPILLWFALQVVRPAQRAIAIALLSSSAGSPKLSILLSSG